MGRFFTEAESFENLGGWVVDQQSMNIMGSSYIMAHGLGSPVADAVTHIKLPESGKWYAYVRTRDWTAVWKRGTPAGTFKLMIDDNCFENTLGTNGEEWDWQYAGAMELEGGKTHRMSLRDLTGFNGRCDAVFLTTDKNDIPKNTEEFRSEVSGVTAEEDETLYDMVVCGGGIAGTCMALAAVREGINVCLIQDRPVLGGCNSSEIKVGLGGQVRSEPYPNLGNVLQDISPVFGSPGSFDGHFYEDERKANAFYTAKVWANGRYTLSLNERVIALEKNGDKISSVTTKNIYTGKIKKYKGRLFADCTGDAVLARLGGADVMYGREAADEYNEQLAPEKADNQVMGMTVTWYSEKTDKKDEFPDIDWGIEFDEKSSYKVFGGDWEWEAGQYRDMADETEYIRDYSLMTVFGNWSFLKNRYSRKEEYAFRRLKWASPLGGKRESYRVKGDLVLNENDIENHIPHEDETASATWDIDIHYPDPMNVKLFPEPFRSCAIHRGIGRHYPVPYRCLYSKDISNLFLGGRIISATHIAFSCVRVMRTLGVLGEVAGLAAAICTEENCLPRDIYTTHFEKLKRLMERGVVIKPYHAYEPGNYEHLAFPECNKYVTYPEGTALPLDNKERMWRINNMGAKYMTYAKFKGIENREELTDEEKQIAERFYLKLRGG